MPAWLRTATVAIVLLPGCFCTLGDPVPEEPVRAVECAWGLEYEPIPLDFVVATSIRMRLHPNRQSFESACGANAIACFYAQERRIHLEATTFADPIGPAVLAHELVHVASFSARRDLSAAHTDQRLWGPGGVEPTAKACVRCEVNGTHCDECPEECK